MSEIRTASLDMSKLIEERRAANAMRGEMLQLIAEDALTPWEAVVAVATSGERPLMRLTLGQLITASEGIGRARAQRTVEQVLSILGTTEAGVCGGRVTLAFLLDEQARGRRLLAVLDAFISHGLISANEDLAIWPGFPFSPVPADPKEER